jgi:hypothetical protein
VVKTNVHYPTDINLLYDAVRKAISLIANVCDKYNDTSWRQYQYNIRQVKKSYRQAQQSKRAGDVEKTQSTHLDYINLSEYLLSRVEQTHAELYKNSALSLVNVVTLGEITKYIEHGHRQVDQIHRRVILGETIPHDEKVFSLFEPHTEWINKGKAGVPVELGLKVCIFEDQHQFILHHRVMQKETDDKVATLMLEEVKKRFPNIHSVSYDRGFYSTKNRDELQKMVAEVALPKKGKRSEKDENIENSEAFKNAKKKHSAVESAINALDCHGLDKCLDRGLPSFKRYVALAIVARNIQRIGSILVKRKQRLMVLHRARERQKAA